MRLLHRGPLEEGEGRRRDRGGAGRDGARRCGASRGGGGHACLAPFPRGSPGSIISMIGVDQALEELLGALESLPSRPASLRHASGRVLARDAVAERDSPPFDTSAM